MNRAEMGDGRQHPLLFHDVKQLSALAGKWTELSALPRRGGGPSETPKTNIV